jgi:ribokinase
LEKLLKHSLNINAHKLLYKTMIGVGGIGSGKFFLVDGNHTLGREESRGGRFLDTRDYCKLHIISHYVQVLLGYEFKVIPIGKIGNDDIGAGLIKEMDAAGICIDFVRPINDVPTLFAFCIVYPDGSGGNLTPNDSACAKIDDTDIEEAESEFNKHYGSGIALAAPEVPLKVREKLLLLGTEKNFFRIASFTSEEMQRVITSDIIQHIDLLAINLDEAAAAVDMSVENNKPKSIIEKVINKLSGLNSDLKISFTHGREGSWSWDGVELFHVPAHDVPVDSTAGAGDAHLSGIIAGLTAGLALKEAQQLGSLMGAHSVTSPHTINPDTNRKTLKSLADKSAININDHVWQLLEE